ncbi:uncharacterized protein A4U43_C01F15000 [Asparagus officinalis]|uniref:Peptide methionine sulfoxide reductase A5 n=1 Tax=Asparagus officinalis TaxID=4686 RepID=A0A5P1FU40_ASPOF|nr:uncharacterized protein A4U43_C01F15000 [Asparagus officinalis]
MGLRNHSLLSFLLFTFLFSLSDPTLGIRIPDPTRNQRSGPVKVAVFALGSFWRSEAAFGCVPGVVRTSVGYSGGTKSNPEYRNVGGHAECVRVEYDPDVIQYKQLLDVFWANHDSRQVFGQGPDVGDQYRSIIFTNGTLEARLAAASKEREQTKSRSSIKFELKRNRFLQQLIGNMPDLELVTSSLAAKLNGYAAELCPPEIQKKIDSKIDDILKNGWPILRNI